MKTLRLCDCINMLKIEYVQRMFQIENFVVQKWIEKKKVK